jgi:hypothetical protein
LAVASMMKSFCSKEHIDDLIECESCERKQPCTKELEYKLCAMVNHSGGIGGGHYTAAEEKMEVGSWRTTTLSRN